MILEYLGDSLEGPIPAIMGVMPTGTRTSVGGKQNPE